MLDTQLEDIFFRLVFMTKKKEKGKPHKKFSGLDIGVGYTVRRYLL